MTGTHWGAIRVAHGMTQADFWGRVGVTQGGGSRYEAGRRIPKPTQLCLTIAYGTKRKAMAEVKRLRGS